MSILSNLNTLHLHEKLDALQRAVDDMHAARLALWGMLANISHEEDPNLEVCEALSVLAHGLSVEVCMKHSQEVREAIEDAENLICRIETEAAHD